MNGDEIYDDEMNDDMERLFHHNISDESAVAICDFMAKLLLVVDSRYLHKYRRYREAHSPPVDPGTPWKSIQSD